MKMIHNFNIRSSSLAILFLLQSVPLIAASGWASQGCFSDSSTSRALQAASRLNSPTFDSTECVTFCEPYLYSGIENGRDCYCDNVIHSPSVRISDDSCNVLCTGQPDTYCGGLNAIQIFKKDIPPPIVWNSLGCYTDSTSSRTLRTASYTSVSAMTIASCQAFCAPGNYKYAGVEYARECYCDNTIHSPGVPASSSDCNMPCTGDSSTTCGAGDRIQIYQRQP
ncbi:WSC domain-containing protein [Crucibulum laeve]|uniref:WSC domain-containing protein n=1 Tax=Crucibulum laeve TaxID=68775 RepID=A0A5C3LTT8_9AGAR|nr:WSC domain-containing protein [Crucibulum laeve]